MSDELERMARDTLGRVDARADTIETDLMCMRYFAKRIRNAALDEAAALIRKLHAEPHCVNGHDRCYEGPDESCPYCEKRSDLEDTILALKEPT